MTLAGYSYDHVFSKTEVYLYKRAKTAVECVLTSRCVEGLVRCHELARAVGRVLDLPFEDGHYGFVDHSWLWTKPKPVYTPTPRLGLPNILDVYCVGSLPMVRLVDCSAPALPHAGWAYRPGPLRKDIDEERVKELVALIEEEGP